MVIFKSRLFPILLTLTIFSAISLISAVVVDDNVNVNEIEDCHTEFYDDAEDVFDYVNRERDVYGSCTNYHNYTHCSNTSGLNTDCSEEQFIYNFSCVIGTESYQSYEKTGEQVVQKNKVICTKKAYTVEIAGSTKKIDFDKFGYYCSLDNNILTCDSVHDGDGNGICHPGGGETCIKFELTSSGINTIQKKIDSVALNDIEIENV